MYIFIICGQDHPCGGVVPARLQASVARTNRWQRMGSLSLVTPRSNKLKYGNRSTPFGDPFVTYYRWGPASPSQARVERSNGTKDALSATPPRVLTRPISTCLIYLVYPTHTFMGSRNRGLM